jgi:hypothetical protein
MPVANNRANWSARPTAAARIDASNSKPSQE